MAPTISANSLLAAASTSQIVNVTGRRLTSTDTTFTIAAFARVKGSGGYGNWRASPAAFTSGHLATSEGNKIMRARKSQRQWRQLRWKPEREFPLIPGLRE